MRQILAVPRGLCYSFAVPMTDQKIEILPPLAPGEPEFPAERGSSRLRVLGLGAGGAVAVGATALGALAIGALAFGAVAVGAFAIGRLSVGRARIRRLDVDELAIGKISRKR